MPRGRPVGSKNRNAGAKRAPRDLVQLNQNTGAARFFDRMIRDVESDLGGRRVLSRIEGELVRAFAGSATALQYLNNGIVLGEAVGEIDLSAYATLASTMLRIGSRLGFSRRPRMLPQELDAYLAAKTLEAKAVEAEAEMLQEADE